MAKPRIIIADTNERYIYPLQQKFVEDFFEKIDLEIISDREYFEEFFSYPQRADVLIISENLYNDSLQRHNLEYVFLMQEERENEEIVPLNINRIYKYSSNIDVFFDEIIAKSGIKPDIKKEPQIVLVYSASGGVGKTTVAMGISACLTKNHKRVLYMNAEHMQSFQHMLKNVTPIPTHILTNEEGNIYEKIRYLIREETFLYVPPFKAALMSLELNYSIYGKLALSAKKSGDYDYIILDADSVFDEEKAQLLELADKVIIVTNQTKASIYATKILMSNMNRVNNEKYSFICNNFDTEQENSIISPNLKLEFTINSYIEHFRYYERMSIESIAKENDIQKATMLVV